MAISNETREVLYMFGHTDVGFTPGSFGEAIITAFTRADAINSAKLASVYPEYGHAVHTLQNVSNGREVLLNDAD